MTFKVGDWKNNPKSDKETENKLYDTFKVNAAEQARLQRLKKESK